jgi:hypothetical protein
VEHPSMFRNYNGVGMEHLKIQKEQIILLTINIWG